MRISKAELKEFVKDKINMRIAEEQKQARQIVADRIRPTIESIYDEGWKDLGDRINSVIDDYQTYINNHSKNRQYDYIMGYLHNAMNTKSRSINDAMGTIAGNLIDGHTDGHSILKRDEVSALVSEVSKLVESHKSKIRDLRSLREQAVTIIDQYRSGNKAYDHLVSLGFNMSGFAPVENKLPSVIKLTVDPSILD